MLYTIEFTTSALREFRSLPADIQARIRPKIDALAENPLPAGVKKLAGEPAHFRFASEAIESFIESRATNSSL